MFSEKGIIDQARIPAKYWSPADPWKQWEAWRYTRFYSRASSARLALPGLGLVRPCGPRRGTRGGGA